MKLRMLTAKYYKAVYKNNLQIVGVEDGRPLLIGEQKDLDNFFNSEAYLTN